MGVSPTRWKDRPCLSAENHDRGGDRKRLSECHLDASGSVITRVMDVRLPRGKLRSKLTLLPAGRSRAQPDECAGPGLSIAWGGRQIVENPIHGQRAVPGGIPLERNIRL